ncbi:SF1B family DNA helicase RecD2 [Gallicola sp. Sow4_E12]|uniref:SF1B family DNA helicase RecD2 n=1 Tax=Gallicola sp. Sow4_E12 TaxID=3438785 RepID=UPI003F903F1F
MKIEGIVKSIVFENEQNNYRVLRVESEDGEIMATGQMPPIIEGEEISMEGEWIYHDKYGEQLQVTDVEKSGKVSPLMIEKYVGSGILPHVGKTMAKRIVKVFGRDTLAILQENPSRLMEVEGIGKKKFEDIKIALEDQRQTQEVYFYLQRLGIGMAQSKKIIDKYQDETIQKIEENPYQLVNDIWGIGFKTADSIALRNQLDPSSPFRIKSGCVYYLKQEAESNGHCYMPYDYALERISRLLNLKAEDIDEMLVEAMMENLILIEYVGEEKVLYLPEYYDAEIKVAGKIAQIASRKEIIDVDLENRWKELEKKYRLSFSEEQKEAIRSSLEEQILIITGGPGTGKTTIIQAVVDLFIERSYEVTLSAPTGRAAKRLEQSCKVPAKTIHRLLGYKPVDEGRGMFFDFNEENPLLTDLLIIDEASMMDLRLCESLFRGIGEETRIIFVGDVDQLPSVGAGNVLEDMIRSGEIRKISLKTIFRQGKESNIVLNAHKINHGEEPILNEKGKDFFFMQEKNPSLIQKKVLELVARRLPEYYKLEGPEEIQILTPMKKGELGTLELNRNLQEVINPKTPDKEELYQGDRIFRKKDRVMQIRNDYTKSYKTLEGQEGMGVFNGDFGVISDVDPSARTIEVIFDEERRVQYSYKELDELSLSYSITIHKSQGSEFPVIIIPIGPGPYMLLTRNLIYTAITRAKRVVVLVGDPKYLYYMIHNNPDDRRHSSLDKRIREYIQVYKGVYEGDD